MNLQRWIARREPQWQRLDRLLTQVEKHGVKSLKGSEIQELASLYRSVCADLARAQTHQVGQTLIKDLQILTARSYNQIYHSSHAQEWQTIVDFYRWQLPASIQQASGCIALATILFGLGFLTAWWYGWQDPSFVSLLLPPHILEKVQDQGQLWMGSIVGIEPFASSQIMTNNLSVASASVAGGITAGATTGWIMAYNGLHIGAAAVLVTQNNLGYPFWAFVFPHGSLELPAIFFAGGAGFLLAKGILFPGKYKRTDALRIYGTQAAQLVFGIIPMLAIAGLIEGFFSPSPLVPDAFKYLVGIGIFVSLVIYCTRQQPSS